MDNWTDDQKDNRTDNWMDNRMDNWTDNQTDNRSNNWSNQIEKKKVTYFTLESVESFIKEKIKNVFSFNFFVT